MERKIVSYGFKTFINVPDTPGMKPEETCKQCYFHCIENNGEVTCEAPCDVRFWGCSDGHFHWEKKRK